MDFLECPTCNQRYLVRDAEGGDGWICRHCGGKLRLVALNLPGEEEEAAEALDAAKGPPDREL